jgi:hypothetical protein
MKRTVIIRAALAAAVLVYAAHTGAQQSSVSLPEKKSVFEDYLNPADSDTGFLRIPGLKFHSSVGFSYSTSQYYGDMGMGYYMGHFTYQLHRTVTLNWDVGVGSYMMGGSGTNEYQVFIPNLDVTWRPSDNLMVRLQYMQGGRLNPYYSRRGFGF